MSSNQTEKKGILGIFRRKISLLIGLVMLLIGCLCGGISGVLISPSESEQPQQATGISLAVTQSSIGTYTPYPTYTENPTYTPNATYTEQPTREPIIITATSSPTPRFTPTETATPSITPTPTKTSTATPTPNATQTQQAIINATQGADATATKAAQYAIATEMADYEKIDYNELVTYADSHSGEKVWVEGRIFNINGNTELQMYLGWTYDAAYIVMREPFSGIYEDNWIVVYGTVFGENCGTNAFGGEVCQPLIIDAFFEKK